MEQHTDSSGVQARAGHVFLLKKAMYGLKQAGNIWGSTLCDTAIRWGFKASRIDYRVFFKAIEEKFLILIIVVDDMKFMSNSSVCFWSFRISSL